MRTDDFDFDGAANAIPTDPLELRGRDRADGRMVVLNRAASTIEHRSFPEICDQVVPGDVLVFNDSYMLSNTLRFIDNDRFVNVYVAGAEPDGSFVVELSAPLYGTKIVLSSADDPTLTCALVARNQDQTWKARFHPSDRLVPALEVFGTRCDETIPLNPGYWRQARQAYRSVYARVPGSLEIPSAGLHFSRPLLDRLAGQGVEFAYVTLHVGATEALAVRHIAAEHVEQHTVREEWCEISAEAAACINRAKAEGRRVIAVGTTVVRTLETIATRSGDVGPIQPQNGWTGLYIYPGFQFRVVDAILTNLHRPRSSHIVLTAAFAGADLLMRSYREIVAMGGYEFDMFGDSMLIV